MSVNANQMKSLKEYKYPHGTNLESVDDLASRISKAAAEAGISCNIYHDELASGTFEKLLNLTAADCLRITKTQENTRKKGMIRSFAKRTFSSSNGDFVITFSGEGRYAFMHVYITCETPAIITMLDRGSSGPEPEIIRDNWSVIMEDIIDEVAEGCKI